MSHTAAGGIYGRAAADNAALYFLLIFPHLSKDADFFCPAERARI